MMATAFLGYVLPWGGLYGILLFKPIEPTTKQRNKLNAQKNNKRRRIKGNPDPLNFVENVVVPLLKKFFKMFAFFGLYFIGYSF